jgi:hypothetical protein
LRLCATHTCKSFFVQHNISAFFIISTLQNQKRSPSLANAKMPTRVICEVCVPRLRLFWWSCLSCCLAHLTAGTNLSHFDKYSHLPGTTASVKISRRLSLKIYQNSKLLMCATLCTLFVYNMCVLEQRAYLFYYMAARATRRCCRRMEKLHGPFEKQAKRQ